jgi:hypothetical protein
MFSSQGVEMCEVCVISPVQALCRMARVLVSGVTDYPPAPNPDYGFGCTHRTLCVHTMFATTKGMDNAHTEQLIHAHSLTYALTRSLTTSRIHKTNNTSTGMCTILN